MIIQIMHPRTNEIFIINATSEVLLSYFLRAYCVIDPEEKRAGKMHTIILKNNDTELIINHKKIFVKKIDEAILLINRYIRNNISFINNWNAYHASSVVIEKKAFMLMGESGAGKTTLTAYLNIMFGVTVLTEDMTIINCNSCEIVPQNVALALRENSINLLSDQYGCDIRKKCRYHNKRFIYTPSIEEDAHKYNIARVCYVLRREPGRKKVEKKKIDSSFVFIKNSYCSQNIWLNIELAQKIYDQIDAYELYYDDLNMVYSFFKNQ